MNKNFCPNSDNLSQSQSSKNYDSYRIYKSHNKVFILWCYNIMLRKCFINTTEILLGQIYIIEKSHTSLQNKSQPPFANKADSFIGTMSLSFLHATYSEITLRFRYSCCWGKRSQRLALDSLAEPQEDHTILIPGVYPHQYFQKYWAWDISSFCIAVRSLVFYKW